MFWLWNLLSRALDLASNYFHLQIGDFCEYKSWSDCKVNCFPAFFGLFQCQTNGDDCFTCNFQILIAAGSLLISLLIILICYWCCKQINPGYQEYFDDLNYGKQEKFFDLSMMDRFRPGAAGMAASTVELSVSCRNLLDMDILTVSDPMCVLSCKDFKTGEWVEYGRTETIDNTLNPDFVKKFIVNYFFEERQCLKFSLYDIDTKSADLSQHDFLGSAECSLGEIVSEGRHLMKLKGPKPDSGTITVCAEELSSCKEEVTLQLSGKKLDKKDWFGSSDPFLAFYRVNEDGTFTVCHRTEVIKHNLNPSWRPFTLPVRVLCAGDYNRSILVRCNDWNMDGKEKLIGEFTTNLGELIQAQAANTTFQLINRKHQQKKKSYRNSGTVFVTFSKVVQTHSFLDFVTAGTQLNCTIAIDFTASNGNPSNPSSLHHINPYQPNQYAVALRAVGEIIQDYDSDKLFPVLGFGARLPPDGRVSHEFFVNGHTTNPYCNGISGVLESYHRCLAQIQLYGPTNFAPVINHVARFAAAKKDGSEYFILLIITDGVITDMPQTKDAIVAASGLPLSIIIVGVGTADFEAMVELDGDDDGPYKRLRNRAGQFAQRDIVQFVAMKDFIRGVSSADFQISQARLAKEVLEEIPDQFLSYMKSNHIAPGSWRGSGPNDAQPPTAPTAQEPFNSFGSSPDAPPPYPGF